MRAIVKSKGVMPSLLCVRSAMLLCGFGLALANELHAQAPDILKVGQEFSASNARAGDQTVGSVAIGPGGGYAVWQDNIIDGAGKSFGIGGRRLSQELTPTNYPFRINQVVNGPQENPRVTMMRNGGAAFVWQGGRLGNQDIYFRTMTPVGWLSPLTDVRVNKTTRGQQSTPTIACLANGNLAVAWTSLHQDGNMEGVYARLLTPKGTFVSGEFRVNQFTGNNQRNPAVAALSNGNFVVVWLSDNQGVSAMESLRHTNRVHVYARVYTIGGGAVCNEFRVNTRSNLCAHPSVARAATGGGFTVVWAEKNDHRGNNWDIYARTFIATNRALTDAVLVNSITEGDQFAPEIAFATGKHLVVWNALGLDGSREGVFGRLLNAGHTEGQAFMVNSHTPSSQITPAVASDDKGRFLVAWSSYFAPTAYDLRAQQFSSGIPSTGGTLGTPVTLVGQPKDIPLPLADLRPPVVVSPPGGSSSNPAVQLVVTLANTSKGKLLRWNTQPGRVYQVQYSTDFGGWSNLGPPRLAVGTSDAMLVGLAESAVFYRVMQLP